jgi:hypothetical protein
MRITRAFALLVLAALAAGCTVQPAVPVAVAPAPIVVAPAPVFAAPAYRPHPGRGWKHRYH